MAGTAATLRASGIAPLPRARSGFWSDALGRLRRDPTTMAAIAVLVVLIALAVGADLLAEQLFHAPFARTDLSSQYHAPSLEQPALWLGTDQLGRSIAVRLLYGGRVSLAVGSSAALVAVVIGIAVGMSAGYFRGWWDDVVVWVVTTIQGIPAIALLLTIGLLFRPDPWSLAAFLGLLGWLGVANLARGQTFALREREFIVGARAVGASPWRIMGAHVFPNILPLMVVIAALDVASLILAESTLSFLGFGVQPPWPSWGNMLTGATQHFTRGPWLVYAPGVAITVTVLCFYLIGDGLRDALDPRLRGQR